MEHVDKSKTARYMHRRRDVQQLGHARNADRADEASVVVKVGLDDVQAWLADARKQGSVGVLMRVRSTSEHIEEGQLPPGGNRYRKGDLVLTLYPQSP